MNSKYIAIRMLRALLTLWFVVTLVFFMIRLAGDPVVILLPEDTPANVVEQYRARWGMDGPLYVQYAGYLAKVLHGDFGQSFRDGRPALDIVAERIPATLTLSLAGLLVAVFVGIPAGIVAAVRRGGWMDRFVIGLSVLGHSMPTFFFGILLILLFSMVLRWLPSSGSATWRHLLMPAATLGLWNAATLARFTRSAMIDALAQPFIRAALANGLPAWRRILLYALPNASISIITILGLLIGQFLSGAVIVETVFSWPGLGRLTVTAVAAREVAIIQTIVFFAALTMVTANLLVDVAYRILDPRIDRSLQKA
jgi:peptide/nickel transport system permease protein